MDCSARFLSLSDSFWENFRLGNISFAMISLAAGMSSGSKELLKCIAALSRKVPASVKTSEKIICSVLGRSTIFTLV